MIMNLKIPEKFQFTNDDFFEFCQQNRDMKFEKRKDGQIILGMPTGSKTGNKNVQLIVELELWNRQTKSGYVFDSSTGFTLPNLAVRSPDASWVSRLVWEALSEPQKERFAPICPDFVIELMSETDSLKECKEKMQDYMESGCRLAWLIDTDKKMVYVYHSISEIMEVKGFDQSISASPILEGFILDLKILN
jgi:Uma2 family endonuclease